MTDREKVIKGLCDAIGLIHGYIPKRYWGYGEQACRDAITLLKEQDAVEPIKKDTVEITARYGYECPCGAPLLIGQPFCAGCGRKVKWDG